MKTLFRVLSLAVLLTAFSALTFAQEPTLEALFTKFRTEIKAKCGERDPALATGKTIIEKFGNDELNKEIIDFVKKKMAEIEKTDPRCKAEIFYNNTYKAAQAATAAKAADANAKWAEFLNASKKMMALEGDTDLGLDILLTHVSVQSYQPGNEAETVSDAKLALQRIDAGKTSKTGNWGVFGGWKTKDYPDGKANAQGSLNFIIGSAMHEKLNQKKEALPYLFKAIHFNNENQKVSSNYTNIGNFYFDEAIRYDGEYRTKLAANNKEENDETKQLLGLARANADRSADAFGRAYKVVTTPTTKAAIQKRLVDLYKFRFNIAEAKQPEVDKYVADLVAKPMPDPATAVTPVVVEAPTTTTSTTPSTTPTTTTPATNTKTAPTTNTKATTTPAKQPTSSTTNGTTEASTATKTPVKKPVTKKKGTR